MSRDLEVRNDARVGGKHFLSVLLNEYFMFCRIIKMSSPRLNNVIVAGCILTYFSVILFGLDGGLVPTKRYGQVCIVSKLVRRGINSRKILLSHNISKIHWRPRKNSKLIYCGWCQALQKAQAYHSQFVFYVIRCYNRFGCEQSSSFCSPRPSPP